MSAAGFLMSMKGVQVLNPMRTLNIKPYEFDEVGFKRMMLGLRIDGICYNREDSVDKVEIANLRSMLESQDIRDLNLVEMVIEQKYELNI